MSEGGAARGGETAGLLAQPLNGKEGHHSNLEKGCVYASPEPGR